MLAYFAKVYCVVEAFESPGLSSSSNCGQPYYHLKMPCKPTRLSQCKCLQPTRLYKGPRSHDHYQYTVSKGSSPNQTPLQGSSGESNAGPLQKYAEPSLSEGGAVVLDGLSKLEH